MMCYKRWLSYVGQTHCPRCSSHRVSPCRGRFWPRTTSACVVSFRGLLNLNQWYAQDASTYMWSGWITVERSDRDFANKLMGGWEMSGYPETIRIGFMDYNLKFVPKGLRNPIDGEHCSHTQSMRVVADTTGQYRASVVLHEVIHGCFYTSGLRDDGKLTEESVAESLSHALCGVIRDNPDLVKVLQKDLRGWDKVRLSLKARKSRGRTTAQYRTPPPFMIYTVPQRGLF